MPSCCRSGYSRSISGSVTPPASSRSTVATRNPQTSHARDAAHLGGINGDALEVFHRSLLVIVATPGVNGCSRTVRPKFPMRAERASGSRTSRFAFGENDCGWA